MEGIIYKYLGQWNKVDGVNNPPPNKELLVLDPDGVTYLSSWRSGYNVFDVQNKMDSTEGWWWVEINLPTD